MGKIGFSSFGNVVAGKLRLGGRLGHGINPSSRKPLWDIPIASSQHLDEAVSAAKAAFPKWSQTSWAERQVRLGQARALLQQHRADMARLISLEGGKPPQFADLEVEHALDFFDFYYFGSIASLGQPDPEVIQDDENLRLTLRQGPIGIVGAICPWNYPLVLAIGKIAPALLAGNCVITKPSPFTPYSIVKFTEIVHHVFPSGVLQAMHGDDDLGPMICNHPDIEKISFTGSTATGKKIMAAASKNLKNITLELGGNSASIVCKDVDVDVVAPQVTLGSFFNSGQLCVASKRLYVHKDIYNAFLKKLVDVVASWKVGPPSCEGVMLGPVQNEMQHNIVKSFIQDTASRGYKFALGGSHATDESSFIIQPCIVDNPPNESLVIKGEAFGPIVPVQPWSDEDELISRVNDVSSGLGGAVWSSDIENAHRLASRIEAGTVWINSFEKPLPQAYLAGHKESGVGGEWGRQGILSYCNPQMIHFYKNSVAPRLAAHI
ncbi:hypothetical protein ACJ41O_012459 [Fusarium nematophilum]